MNREKLFIGLYGYFEVLLNVFSGSLLVFAPQIFLQSTAPSFAAEPFFTSPLVLVGVRLFGYMIVTLGLVQYPAIHGGTEWVRRWFLVGLALGDLFHIVVSAAFAAETGNWTAAFYYGIFMATTLGLSRLYFLWTGVPTGTPPKGKNRK